MHKHQRAVRDQVAAIKYDKRRYRKAETKDFLNSKQVKGAETTNFENVNFLKILVLLKQIDDLRKEVKFLSLAKKDLEEEVESLNFSGNKMVEIEKFVQYEANRHPKVYMMAKLREND